MFKTRFKLKKDAKNFVKELEQRGLKSRIYHGHRDYVVQHDDIMQTIDVDQAESFESTRHLLIKGVSYGNQQGS